MSDPLFRKCLLITKKINADTIPEMYTAYNTLMKTMKAYVHNNSNLNRSREYSKAAISALNSGKIDNSKVRQNLGYLSDVDSVLDNRTRYLTDLLEDIRYRFQAESRKIENKNSEYIQNIKNSDIPANQMLESLVGLGKSIQQVQNDKITGYQKEIEVYIKNAENRIVDKAFNAYNSIMKLDSTTFSAIRSREWTSIPNEFFRTPGAFVNTDYTSGKGDS
jgi:hypothetical protein